MKKRAHIAQEINPRLNKMASAMPRVWAELKDRGFNLQSLFFDELDSLQIDDPDVQPSSIYFAEVIKERVGLFYQPWRLDKRPSDKEGTYRSPYLDLLQQRIDNGSWPELGSARRHVGGTLDPAFMQYLERPFVVDPAQWRKLSDNYRARADAEAASLTRYSALWQQMSRDLSPPTTKRIMHAVLGDAGFCLREDSPPPSFVFSRALRAPDLSIICCLGDPLQMKRGVWSLAIGFCSSKDALEQVTYDAVPILDGMSFWFPAADWYLRHEGSPSRAVLGITVCATLLDSMCKAFDSDID